MLTIVSILGPPLLAPAAVAPLAAEGITVAHLLRRPGGRDCRQDHARPQLCAAPGQSRRRLEHGSTRSSGTRFTWATWVTHVAFLVASPSLWNIVALIAADAALLARAVCEEQTLA